MKIFSLVHISNSLGTINPAAELCARARLAGVTTLVDAAQSSGHLPLDVRELGCDYAQGMLLGEPMSGEALLALLVEQARGTPVLAQHFG